MPDASQLSGSASLSLSGSGELAPYSGSASLNLTSYGWLAPDSRLSGAAAFSLSSYGAADYVQSCAEYAPPFQESINRHITDDYELPNNGAHVFIRWSGPDCINDPILKGSCELHQSAFGALDYETACTTYAAPTELHVYAQPPGGYEPPNSGAHVLVRYEIECPRIDLLGNSTIEQGGLGFLDYVETCTTYLVPHEEHHFKDLTVGYEPPNNGTHIFVRYESECPTSPILFGDSTLSQSGLGFLDYERSCTTYDNPAYGIKVFTPGYELPNDGTHIYVRWSGECPTHPEILGDSTIEQGGLGYLDYDTYCGEYFVPPIENIRTEFIVPYEVPNNGSHMLLRYAGECPREYSLGRATFSLTAKGSLVQGSITDCYGYEPPDRERVAARFPGNFTLPSDGAHIYTNWTTQCLPDTVMWGNSQISLSGYAAVTQHTILTGKSASIKLDAFLQWFTTTKITGNASLSLSGAGVFPSCIHSDYAWQVQNNIETNVYFLSDPTGIHPTRLCVRWDHEYAPPAGNVIRVAGHDSLIGEDETDVSTTIPYIEFDSGPTFTEYELPSIDNEDLKFEHEGVDTAEYEEPAVGSEDQFEEFGDLLSTEYGPIEVDNFILYMPIDGVLGTEYGEITLDGYDQYEEIPGTDMFQAGTYEIQNLQQTVTVYPGFDGFEAGEFVVTNANVSIELISGYNHTQYGDVTIHSDWSPVYVGDDLFTLYGDVQVDNYVTYADVAGIDSLEYGPFDVENLNTSPEVTGVTTTEYGTPTVYNSNQYTYPTDLLHTAYGDVTIYNEWQIAAVSGLDSFEFGTPSIINEDQLVTPIGFDGYEAGTYHIENEDQFTAVEGFTHTEYGSIFIENLHRYVYVDEGRTFTEYGPLFHENADQYVELTDSTAYTEYGSYSVSNRDYFLVVEGIDSLAFGLVTIFNSDQIVGFSGFDSLEYNLPVVYNSVQNVYLDGSTHTEYYPHTAENEDQHITPDGVDTFEVGGYEIENADVFLLVSDGPDSFEYGPILVKNLDVFVTVDGDTQTSYGEPALHATDKYVVIDGFESLATDPFALINFFKEFTPDGTDTAELGPVVIDNYDTHAGLEGEKYTESGEPDIRNSDYHIEVWPDHDSFEYDNPSLVNLDDFVEPLSFERFEAGRPTIINKDQFASVEGATYTEYTEWDDFEVWNYDTIVLDRFGSDQTEFGDSNVYNYETNTLIFSRDNDFLELGSCEIANVDRFVQPDGEDSAVYGPTDVINADRYIEPEGTEQGGQGRAVVLNEYEPVDVDAFDGTEYTNPSIRNEDYLVTPDGVVSTEYGTDITVHNQHRYITPDGFEDAGYSENTIHNSLQFVGGIGLSGREQTRYGDDIDVFNLNRYVYPAWSNISEYGDIELVNESRAIQVDGINSAEYGWLHAHTVDNVIYVEGSDFVEYEPVTVYNYFSYIGGPDFQTEDFDEYGDVSIDNYVYYIEVEDADSFEIDDPDILNTDRVIAVDEGFDNLIVGVPELTEGVRYLDVAEVFTFSADNPEIFNNDQYTDVEDIESECYGDDATVLNEDQELDYETLESLRTDQPAISEDSRPIEPLPVDFAEYEIPWIWNQEHVVVVTSGADQTFYGSINTKNYTLPAAVIGLDSLQTDPHYITNLDQFLYWPGMESLTLGDVSIENEDKPIEVEGSNQTQFGDNNVWNYEQTVHHEDGQTFAEYYSAQVYNFKTNIFPASFDSLDDGIADIINANRDVKPEEVESTEYGDVELENWSKEITPEGIDDFDSDEIAIHNSLHIVDIPLAEDDQYGEPFLENLDYFPEVYGVDVFEPDIDNYEFFRVHNNDLVFHLDSTFGDSLVDDPPIIENRDKEVSVFGVLQLESLDPATIINHESYIGDPDTGEGLYGPCATTYGDVDLKNLDAAYDIDELDSLEPGDMRVERRVRGIIPASYEHSAYGTVSSGNADLALFVEGQDSLVVAGIDTGSPGLTVWSPTQFVGGEEFGSGVPGLTHTQYGGEDDDGKGTIFVQTPSYVNEVGGDDFYEDGGIDSVTQWLQEATVESVDLFASNTFTVGTQQYMTPTWVSTFESGLPGVIRYLEIIFAPWRAETEFGDVGISDGDYIIQRNSPESLVAGQPFVGNILQHTEPDSEPFQFLADPPVVWNQDKYAYFWEDISTEPQTFYGNNADLENVDQEPRVSGIESFESDGWRVTVRNLSLGIIGVETNQTEVGHTWVSNAERSVHMWDKEHTDFDDHTPWVDNIARLVEHSGADSLIAGEPGVELWDTYTAIYQSEHLETGTPTIGTDAEVFFEWYHSITNQNDFGPVTCLFWEQEAGVEGVDTSTFPRLAVDERWNLIKFRGENEPFTAYESPNIVNANKTVEVSAARETFEMELPLVANYIQEPDIQMLESLRIGEIRVGDERDQFVEPKALPPYTEYSINKAQNELPDPTFPFDQFIWHPRDERFDGSEGVEVPEDPAPLTEYYNHEIEGSSLFPNGVDMFSAGDITVVSNILTFYEVTFFEVDYPTVEHFHREVGVQSYVDDTVPLEAQWELEMEEKGPISISPQIIGIKDPKHPMLNCRHDGNSEDGGNSKDGGARCGEESIPEIQNENREIKPFSIEAGYWRYPRTGSNAYEDKFDDPTIADLSVYTQKAEPTPLMYTEFGWFVITPHTKRMYPAPLDSLETDKYDISTPPETVVPFDIETEPTEVGPPEIPEDGIIESTIRYLEPDEFTSTIFGAQITAYDQVYHAPRGIEFEEYVTMTVVDEPWIALDPQVKDIDTLDSLEANWEDFGPRFKIAHRDNHIGVMGEDSLTPGLARLRMPDPCWEN